MNILEELYYGNIEFDTAYYSQDSAFVKAARRKRDSMEQLETLLDESQKKCFEQYCDAQSELEGIRHYTAYSKALRFGVLLMCEMFQAE